MQKTEINREIMGRGHIFSGVVGSLIKGNEHLLLNNVKRRNGKLLATMLTETTQLPISARDVLTQTAELEMTGSPCLYEIFLAIVIARSTLPGGARSRLNCEKVHWRDFNCEKVRWRGSNPGPRF